MDAGPHWRDCILFYEYFHGDNGAGLGASHQTGWTGAIARLMHLFATVKPESILERGKAGYAEATARGPTSLLARDVGSVVGSARESAR